MALEHCRVVLVETHYPGKQLRAAAAASCATSAWASSSSSGRSPIAAIGTPAGCPTHGEAIRRQCARIVADLSEAIDDCVLVVGTSAHVGGLFRQQNVGTPAGRDQGALRHHRGHCGADRPVALLFGPEPTGLSNEVVTRCHYLMRIPTADEYPSLNLAQAVAISLYELFKREGEAPAHEPSCAPTPRQEPRASLDLNCRGLRNAGADVPLYSLKRRLRRNPLSLWRQGRAAHALHPALAWQGAALRNGDETAARPGAANSLACRAPSG